MNNCLNCNKELVHTAGKKQRKYCDAKCKQNHWNKTTDKPKKYVLYKSFKELQDKYEALEGENGRLRLLVDDLPKHGELRISKKELEKYGYEQPKTTHEFKTYDRTDTKPLEKANKDLSDKIGGEGIADKPKSKDKAAKEMPKGLSKTEQIRWMKDNGGWQ